MGFLIFCITVRVYFMGFISFVCWAYVISSILHFLKSVSAVESLSVSFIMVTISVGIWKILLIWFFPRPHLPALLLLLLPLRRVQVGMFQIVPPHRPLGLPLVSWKSGVASCLCTFLFSIFKYDFWVIACKLLRQLVLLLVFRTLGKWLLLRLLLGVTGFWVLSLLQDPSLQFIGMRSCCLFDPVPIFLALGYSIACDPQVISVLAYQKEELIKTIVSPWASILALFLCWVLETQFPPSFPPHIAIVQHLDTNLRDTLPRLLTTLLSSQKSHHRVLNVVYPCVLC